MERSERKKRQHTFDQLKVVFFIIDLTGYCTFLYEDNTILRMHEALNLASQIFNSPFAKDWVFIKVFNKLDYFQKRIQHILLTVCFPGYDGDTNNEFTFPLINSISFNRPFGFF